MVDQNIDEIEDWWKRQLSQLVLVNLPVDYVHQELSSSSSPKGYDHWKQYLNEQLKAIIFNFIDNQQLRPIVFYDSICRVLFYRYTQQSDITWLITCNLNDLNRGDQSLVSRFNCDGQCNFVQLCQQLQVFYNQLIENDCKLLTVPGDKIAKSLEPKSLNVHIIATIKNNLDDEKTESKSAEPTVNTNDYDLVIEFSLDNQNCLSIDYKYKVDIFKKSTIQRLSYHFINLINSLIVDNLNWKLDDHELLDDDEREQLETFNPDYPPNMGSESFFIEMFHQSINNNSNLMAIKEQSSSVTYQQLNEKSNQLAHHLSKNHKVKRGDMIAIMLPQGIDNFITLLATLKLGAAFVPLGIDYPSDRIQYILTDCDEPILITQDKLLSITYNKVLYYSDIDKELSSQSVDNLPIVSSRDDLAYCMYTSGSTGQPKGVQISQRTISFMATSLTDIFSVTRDTRSSLISATAFDAAICESFPVLVQGGLLVLPNCENRYNHNYLVDWLIEEKINYCYLPAKIMDLIFETDLHLKIKHQLRVWASGEPLGAVKVSQESNIQVYNVLGMTELTPLTFVKVNSLRPQDHIKPPVGVPVPGVKAYITDPVGRLCPIGVVGEITYSSPFIAKGYHKLPQQTAEKFTSDPFNGHSIVGSRLLRSGDLARWREDGLIEFFGRADDQVKVRGYRIELSEIEKLLNSLKGIHQSIVLIKKGKRTDDSRIVAFVMLIDEENQSQTFEQSTSWRKNFGSNLHSFLRSNLPYFMLPQVFVVPQFPLNSNGKIDKKVLLSLDNCEPLISSMFHQPCTQMQFDMIKVWSKVLMIPSESLGIDDNFFEHGGHSLLAATIVGQLNQAPFNYPITTRMMLTLATIRSICDLIESDSISSVTIKSIPVLESRTGIDLGIAQSWLALFEIANNGRGVTNEFSYCIVPSKLTWNQVNQAVNCLIERHEALRLVMSKNKHNKIKQSVEPFKPVTIPIVNCSTLDQINKHNEQLKSSIVNIFNGSQLLVKFSFVQFDSRKLIIIVANHMSLDGVSFELIKEELKQLFNQLELKEPLNLSPMKVNFLDYIDWENRTFYCDSQLMEEAKTFWTNRLKGFKAPRLPLTCDLLFCIGDEAQSVYLSFDEKVTQGIENILKEYRTTLFVFTQAVLLSVLHLHTNSTDITVYQAARNINHHLAIPLIGNLVVINFSRVSWTHDQNITFVDLLRKTHYSVMKEHEFRFFPFQKMIGITTDEDVNHNDDFLELVPITITQDTDQNEILELKDFHSTSLTLNALVLHFMKVQSRYTIDFRYSKNCFDLKIIQSFFNCVQHFVQRVSQNPNRPLGQYLDESINMIKW